MIARAQRTIITRAQRTIITRAPRRRAGPDGQPPALQVLRPLCDELSRCAAWPRGTALPARGLRPFPPPPAGARAALGGASPTKGPVVVLAVNGGVLDLVANFLCSARRHGIGGHGGGGDLFRSMLVFAGDDEVGATEGAGCRRGGAQSTVAPLRGRGHWSVEIEAAGTAMASPDSSFPPLSLSIVSSFTSSLFLPQVERAMGSLGVATFRHAALGSFPTQSASGYGDDVFTSMMWLKVVSVYSVLRLGFDVLFQVHPPARPARERGIASSSTYEWLAEGCGAPFLRPTFTPTPPPPARPARPPAHPPPPWGPLHRTPTWSGGGTHGPSSGNDI